MKNTIKLILTIATICSCIACNKVNAVTANFPLPQGFVEFVTIDDSEYNLHFTPNVEYNPDNTWGDDFFIKQCTSNTQKISNVDDDSSVEGKLIIVLNTQGDTLLKYTLDPDEFYTSITTYAKFYKECSMLRSNPKIFEFNGKATIPVAEMEIWNGYYYTYKLTPSGDSYKLHGGYTIQIPNNNPALNTGVVYVYDFWEYYPDGQIRKFIDHKGRVEWFEKGEIVY